MLNYSIIIPFRDKFNLLRIAVNSIPDRKDIEIILIYNGSTDLDRTIIPERTNTQIKVLESSPLKGAGHARNVGLEHVEGRFILFLDSDDYFTEDAFSAFDRYLVHEFDIVFFKPSSRKLENNGYCTRHAGYVQKIDTYLKSGNEDLLRYRWEGPVCKMYRSEFILENHFVFDELKVSNDAWFSLMAGYNAYRIAADPSTVYVITEGEVGQSLVKTKTPDTIFTRYLVAIRINRFLKEIGKGHMRIRLLGFIHTAFREFGTKEAYRFFLYALKNKINIF